MEKHKEVCKTTAFKRMSFPKEDFYKFKKLHFYMDVLFKIFIKFVRYSQPVPVSNISNKALKYTKPSDFSEIMSYGMIIINSENKVVFSKFVDEGNILEDFFTNLFEQVDKIINIVQQHPIKLKVTKNLRTKYREAIGCRICGLNYIDHQLIKSIHHHHQNPNIEPEIICQGCNIGITDQKCVIISHEFCQKDSKTLLQALKPEWIGKIKIIAKSADQILSMKIPPEMRFIDSSLFLNATLEDLVNRLSDNCTTEELKDRFSILYESYGQNKSWQKLTKGINFPFSFSLDPVSCQQPSLKLLNHIQDHQIEYEKLSQVLKLNHELYDLFQCKSIREFAMLYLKVSVFQHAEIVINFVDFAISNTGLSPMHSISLPSFSLDCFMALSKANYQFVKDPEIVNFIESGIRSGIETSNIKLSVANTERLNFDTVTNETRTELLFIVLSSIYASCCTNALPVSDYEFLKPDEIENLDILNVSEDSEFGYICEVKMSYPDHLHIEHNDFPLAPSKRSINISELSHQQ